MYLNFMFLAKLSCKSTHTHRDADEYSKVAFWKNATINTSIANHLRLFSTNIANYMNNLNYYYHYVSREICVH